MADGGPSTAELGLTQKDLGLVGEQKLPNQAIRQFTKSSPEGREARSKTAREIVIERRNIRGNEAQSQSTTSQREALGASIDERQSQVEQLDQQIATIAQELEHRNASLLTRLADRVAPATPQRLSGQRAEALQSKTETKETLQEAYKQYQALGSELQRLQQVKATFRVPSEVLSKFYQEQGGKLKEYENLVALEKYKEAYGQVEIVIDQHGVYFTHGFGSSDVTEVFNGVVRAGADWKDKLAINVIESKPLACRSLGQIRTRRDLFSGIGIILRQGRIERASPTSLESYVTPDGKRKTRFGIPPRSIEDYQRDLVNAIYRPAATQEYIIENPQIAGLFINLDDPQVVDGRYYGGYASKTNKEITVSVQDLQEVGRQYGMKVFAFKNGKAHELSIAPKTGEVILGTVVSPKDMLSQTYEIPEENKAKITQQAKSSLRNNGNY